MLLNDYKELEEKLGYVFKQKRLLDKALTHKSYSVERGMDYNNERLEFLGDSVIGVIVAEHLFKKHYSKDEGILSKIKSYLVSSRNLYKMAKKIELDKYVKISRSASMTANAKYQILSNAFEAVIGAMYIDGGFENAKKLLVELIEASENDYFIYDYKSTIQEYSQKKFKSLPEYKILSESGPEHRKNFTVGLYINNEFISKGSGFSKKEAEQDAAKNAIEKLHIKIK